MDILIKFSTLIGIWVAIYGLDAWRREHVGKRRMELAEDTLSLFYEAADAIRRIRHPASFGHETETVERVQGEADAEYNARKKASVVFFRYNQHRELFSKIHATRYRFMAQFGKEAAQPFEDLHNAVNKIIVAARLLSKYWALDHFRTEEQRQKHWEKVGRQEAIFWDGLEDDDPINPIVSRVVERMEETCRNAMDGSGTLYGFLNRPLWTRRQVESNRDNAR